jgi:sulfite reductase (NADPH) flavoprotein alpha-component
MDAPTVFQSLARNIDIFGKPPERSYEALANFATNANEKKGLLTLGRLEGVDEFKRCAEVDTITYAGTLLEFQSAQPSFHDIVKIIGIVDLI